MLVWSAMDLIICILLLYYLGQIRIWGADNGQCIHQLSPSNSELTPLTQLFYLDATKSLALVTYDHNVMIYDIEELKLKKLVSFP